MDNDLVCLKDLLQSQLDAQNQRFEDEKIHVAERSKLLADNFEQWRLDNDRRLEGMNEMRAQLAKAEASFVTAAVYHAKHEEIERRMSAIEQGQSKIQGTSSSNVAWIAAILSVVTILVMIGLRFTGK